MNATGTAEERAARLLRWYPRTWRERYGEEFTELLIADIAERPRSTARTLDVARGGVVARLTDAGLAGLPLAGAAGTDPRRQVRASIGTLGAALAVCLAFVAAATAAAVLLVRRVELSPGCSATKPAWPGCPAPSWRSSSAAAATGSMSAASRGSCTRA